MTAKCKPSLEHAGESLTISAVWSSKPLTTKRALGICLSSIFVIEQTHPQLSNGQIKQLQYKRYWISNYRTLAI